MLLVAVITRFSWYLMMRWVIKRGKNIANGDGYLDMVGDLFIFLEKEKKVMSMTMMVRVIGVDDSVGGGHDRGSEIFLDGKKFSCSSKIINTK